MGAMSSAWVSLHHYSAWQGGQTQVPTSLNSARWLWHLRLPRCEIAGHLAETFRAEWLQWPHTWPQNTPKTSQNKGNNMRLKITLLQSLTKCSWLTTHSRMWFWGEWSMQFAIWTTWATNYCSTLNSKRHWASLHAKPVSARNLYQIKQAGPSEFGRDGVLFMSFSNWNALCRRGILKTFNGVDREKPSKPSSQVANIEMLPWSPRVLAMWGIKAH